MSTCSEVQHVKVRREVVSDVSPGHMVEVGLMEEVPSVPDNHKKSFFYLSPGLF